MITEIISLVLGAAGLCFGLYQFYQNSKIKRAEQLNSIITRIWSDDEIRSVIQMWEYNDSWYEPSSFHGSARETKIDKTLQYLSYVCYMYKMKLLHENEFATIEYEIVRALKNKSVIEYLQFLYSFSKCAVSDNRTIPFPFIDLLNYGLDKSIISKELFN